MKNKEVELIEKRIARLSDVWQHYFLNFKACNKEINYTEQVKTNYVADIFIYLSDTLSMIPDTMDGGSFQDGIFNAMGLLQTIYAQQDLLDELLLLFCLQKSSGDNKGINRKIRNELIGHPIRRRGDEFISSVFFSRRSSPDYIDYVLYERESGFKGESKKYKWKDILDRHYVFVNEQLDTIWNKITQILRVYQKGLEELYRLLNKIQFKKILVLAAQRYEVIYKENDGYTPDFLSYCDDNSSVHPRYAHLKNLFLAELKSHLEEKIRLIKDLFEPLTMDEFDDNLDDDNLIDDLNFEIIQSGNWNKATANRFQEDNDWGYKFAKLYDDHPIFGISYFMEKHGSDPIVRTELKIMQGSKGTPVFACSYEYLKDYLWLQTSKDRFNLR